MKDQFFSHQSLVSMIPPYNRMKQKQKNITEVYYIS